jgi:hypothetical protein
LGRRWQRRLLLFISVGIIGTDARVIGALVMLLQMLLLLLLLLMMMMMLLLLSLVINIVVVDIIVRGYPNLSV